MTEVSSLEGGNPTEAWESAGTNRQQVASFLANELQVYALLLAC